MVNCKDKSFVFLQVDIDLFSFLVYKKQEIKVKLRIIS